MEFEKTENVKTPDELVILKELESIHCVMAEFHSAKVNGIPTALIVVTSLTGEKTHLSIQPGQAGTMEAFADCLHDVLPEEERTRISEVLINGRK